MSMGEFRVDRADIQQLGFFNSLISHKVGLEGCLAVIKPATNTWRLCHPRAAELQEERELAE